MKVCRAMKLRAPAAAAGIWLALPLAAGATTYFVSKTTSNGYTAGNDGNACTTYGAPCATIIGGLSKMTSGADTVQVNADGTYAETGYPNLVYPGMLTGDPTLCGTAAGGGTYPTLQSSDTTRLLNAGFTGLGTVACFNMDAQSGASKQGVTPQSGNTGVLLRQINWKNFVASQIGGVNVNNIAFTVDRNTCGPDSTGNTFFAFSTDSAHTTFLDIYGGSFSCGTTYGLSFTGGTLGALRFWPDVNGTLPQFPGSETYALIVNSGSIADFRLQGNFSGASGTAVRLTNTSLPSASISNLTVTNSAGSAQGAQVAVMGVTSSNFSINSCNLTEANTGYGALSVASELITNFFMSGCTINGMVGGSASIATIATGGSAQIIGNVFTSPVGGNTQMLKGGSDGAIYGAQNTGTSTFTQNLADVAGNRYVDEPFTTQPMGSGSRAPYISYVDAYLSKTGSPTGNISFSLYADSGGNPTGAALATSATFPASSLTGVVQQVHFKLSTPIYDAPSTKYHVVWTYSGTIDGANYPQLDANGVTTTTVANLQKSADGVTWTPDASHYLRSIVAMGYYGSSPTYAFNTFKYADTTNAAERECVNTGPMLAAYVYGNLCTNAGYIVAKNVLSTPAAQSYMFGNVMSITIGTSTGLYAKASSYMNIINNTVVLGTGAGNGAAGVTAGPDSIGAINPIASDHFTSKNNIIANLGSAATCYSIIGGTTNVVIDMDDCFSPNNTTIDHASGNNWATWQGNGFDINGLTSSPGLPTSPQAKSDFSILPNNPAARGGAPVQNVSIDALGRPFQSPWPMGAIQPANGVPIRVLRRGL